MASVKNLKKDIDYLVSEIIVDAQLFIYLHPAKQLEAFPIIEDVVELRNNLYFRANHPDGKNDPKLVKAHYKSITKDLLEQANSFFERLSQLNGK